MLRCQRSRGTERARGEQAFVACIDMWAAALYQPGCMSHQQHARKDRWTVRSLLLAGLPITARTVNTNSCL
jgi:hypothetical protein